MYTEYIQHRVTALLTADLVNDGDQCCTEMTQLHVCYFVKDILTIADLIQQDHHICALVNTILKISTNRTGLNYVGIMISFCDFITITTTTTTTHAQQF